MHTRYSYLRPLGLAFVFAAVASAVPLREASAQNSQSGEIVLEDTGQQKRPSKAVHEEQATSFITSLEGAVQSGGSGSPPPLTEGGAQHMTVLYLYCLQKLGPCPFILDAILEADVMAARGSGESECPSMKQFWKKWLENQLEQRVKFILSIGNATAVANFNTVQRPRYVRCNETVGKLKEGGNRYGSSGAGTAAVQRTAKLMSDIKERSIDMYASVGFDVGTATRKRK